MQTTTHIRTSRMPYYGAIILVCLIIFESIVVDGNSDNISGIPAIIIASVVVISLYKIFSRKGKIIFAETEFKVQGYNWTNWNELVAVYPFEEQDSENGTRSIIRFRLTDGTDLDVSSTWLEMSFEQIAELVNEYKSDYQNKLSGR